MIEKPCRTCHGSGRERRTKRYEVKIPAGVKDGTRIKLKGKGEPGRGGGPPGDLHVITRVEPSPLYERQGSDLVIEVPVTYAEAALGARGRGADAGRPHLAQGARRLAGRQDAPRPRPGRAEAEGRRARATCSRASASSVPTKLTKAEREAIENLQKVERDNPREAAFS